MDHFLKKQKARKIKHWQEVLAHSYQERLDPKLPLQAFIAKYLPKVKPLQSSVAILEAEAGALTMLGKHFPNYPINLTATDRHAHELNQMLAEKGIEPLVKTEACEVENLLSKFPQNTFDCAYINNLMLSSVDPVAAIVQLIAVVKPGGFVLVHGKAPRKTSEKPQWWLHDEQLYFQDEQGNEQNISQLIQDFAKIHDMQHAKNNERVLIAIQKFNGTTSANIGQEKAVEKLTFPSNPPTPQAPLIFDVGANNGDDTMFYLRKGFRVVAIEADPELAASLETQFYPFIKEGQLTVRNVAVTDAKKTVTFYKNSKKSDWSSLLYESKATQRHSYETLEVPGETLSSIMAEFGEVYYLKIDIEGGELDAIRSLKDVKTKPRYLSFECNPTWQEVMELLKNFGYSKYKLITQGTNYLQSPPKPALEGHYVECKFTGYMSGTFGKETPGRWRSYDELMSDMQTMIDEQNAKNWSDGVWHDIHAAL